MSVVQEHAGVAPSEKAQSLQEEQANGVYRYQTL
jgi:hypothetical protein